MQPFSICTSHDGWIDDPYLPPNESDSFQIAFSGQSVSEPGRSAELGSSEGVMAPQMLQESREHGTFQTSRDPVWYTTPIFSPQFLPITRFIFRSCWGAHFLGTPEAKPSSFSTPLSRDRGDVGCHRGPKAWEGWR